MAPILVAPNWNKPFRGHVDASQLAVGGNLTQLDENGRDRVISFHSKKLSPAESDYTSNDRELLALINFLGRFRCYLEGSEFEIFTDNQVLKSFFTKPKLCQKEARWLETLGNFGIFPITLKPGRIHVLGDALSRAPHVTRGDRDISVNDVEIPYLDVDQIIPRYDEDQFFGPVVKAMEVEWPEDMVQKQQHLKEFCRCSEKMVRGCFTMESCVYREGQFRVFCKLLMTRKLVDILNLRRHCPDYITSIGNIRAGMFESIVKDVSRVSSIRTPIKKS